MNRGFLPENQEPTARDIHERVAELLEGIPEEVLIRNNTEIRRRAFSLSLAGGMGELRANETRAFPLHSALREKSIVMTKSTLAIEDPIDPTERIALIGLQWGMAASAGSSLVRFHKGTGTTVASHRPPRPEDAAEFNSAFRFLQ